MELKEDGEKKQANKTNTIAEIHIGKLKIRRDIF